MSTCSRIRHQRLTGMLAIVWALLASVGVVRAEPGDEILGFWQGAYVRSDSVQLINAQFLRDDATGDLLLRVEVPEWMYYGWLAPKKVTIEDDGRFSFDGFYGRTLLAHDAQFGELIGQSGSLSPSVTLHLKRSLPPVPDGRRRVDLQFTSGDGANVGASLVLPAGDGPHPVIVLFGGRGCTTRQAQIPRARMLAKYGIAALALDKRGRGETEGACETSTFDQLVMDGLAAVKHLGARDDIDASRIAVYGGSAGAWVATRVAATSEIPIAAVMTFVGPSTSVEEQQRDNCRLICDELDLSDDDRAKSTRYLDLMFNDLLPTPEAQFEEMMALKAHAEATGWDDFFAPTDIPDSPAGIERLWVRRFQYDPADDLRTLTCPILWVLGGTDTVVPAQKNADRLRALYGGSSDDLHIRIVEGLGHGSEHPDMWRTIRPGGPETRSEPVTYMKFDKVDWQASVPMLDFARDVFGLD